MPAAQANDFLAAQLEGGCASARGWAPGTPGRDADASAKPMGDLSASQSVNLSNATRGPTRPPVFGVQLRGGAARVKKFAVCLRRCTRGPTARFA